MRKGLSSRAVWWLVAIGRLGGAIAAVAVVVALWMFFIRAPLPEAPQPEPSAPAARQPKERRVQERPPARAEAEEAPLRAFVLPAQAEVDKAVFQIEVIFGIGIGGAVLFLVLFFFLYTPPSSWSPRKSSVKTPHSKGDRPERPSREPKEERKVWNLDDPNDWE